MRLLAFDTSTDVMSIAVCRGAGELRRVWQHSAVGGAQASAGLIPAILRLMAQAELAFADLDAIVFGRGPGAFTGLRAACAVAQGLGFGSQTTRACATPVPLLPVDTLLALAEQARQQCAAPHAGLRVLALLDARMDQIYSAGYAFDGAQWEQTQAHQLDQPQDIQPGSHNLLAGNVFSLYGARLPASPGAARIDAVPTAGAMLRLAPALLAGGHGVDPEHALPLYVRDKVARTSVERAADAVASAR